MFYIIKLAFKGPFLADLYYVNFLAFFLNKIPTCFPSSDTLTIIISEKFKSFESFEMPFFFQIWGNV